MIRVPIGGPFDADKLLTELHTVPALQPRPHPVLGVVAVTSIDGADLCLPDDADLREVARIVATHDGKPRQREKTKRQHAREKLAAIDGTKITGETRKLLAILADLLDD